MVVGEVLAQDSLQVPFVEYDHVVEALPADDPDHELGI
jgi:hypothetical protein